MKTTATIGERLLAQLAKMQPKLEVRAEFTMPASVQRAMAEHKPTPPVYRMEDGKLVAIKEA